VSLCEGVTDTVGTAEAVLLSDALPLIDGERESVADNDALCVRACDEVNVELADGSDDDEREVVAVCVKLGDCVAVGPWLTDGEALEADCV
jgi:hypothetical protein